MFYNLTLYLHMHEDFVYVFIAGSWYFFVVLEFYSNPSCFVPFSSERPLSRTFSIWYCLYRRHAERSDFICNLNIYIWLRYAYFRINYKIFRIPFYSCTTRYICHIHIYDCISRLEQILWHCCNKIYLVFLMASVAHSHPPHHTFSFCS